MPRIKFDQVYPGQYQGAFCRAYVEGRPELNGVAPDWSWALGRLIWAHPEFFGVELITDNIATIDDR